MFRIKICGITRVEDASAAAEAGADAIGLNFYAKSRRYVSNERAREIAAVVPDGVAIVGVFVNADAEEIYSIRETVGLDTVQLHGDEPPELLSAIADCPIIRAFRCRDGSLDELARYLDACERIGRMPDAVLVDAYSPGEFGGTGESVDWHSLAAERVKLRGLPLILAGGLRPENVAEAIRVARPDAVDTASGVESSPGVKDHELIRRFIAESRELLR